MTEEMEYVRPETIGQVAYAAYHLTTDGWTAMDAPSRKRWERIGHTVFDWGSGHAAAAAPATGYGPDAEVQADDAKDRLIAELRQSLEDQVTINGRLSRVYDIAEQSRADLADQLKRFHADEADGGRWERIAFMGHLEYAGWVTEITRNGQAAYRVELPAYHWGGDPDAWVEHAASSWFSSKPTSEEGLRRAWEAKRARDAEIAEWHAQRQALALEPASDDDEAKAIALEEAMEDWDAPDRVRDDHEHGETGDDDSDVDPF